MKYETVLEREGNDIPEWPMYIDGDWVGAVEGAWADATCPSREGTVLARVPSGTPADVDRAVAAARAAQPGWAALHFTARQRALLRIADALEAEAEALAVLTAQDTGNALRTQARPESATLAALFRYFAGVSG
jgi:aldehyde dehydrogenase (NAD+)